MQKNIFDIYPDKKSEDELTTEGFLDLFKNKNVSTTTRMMKLIDYVSLHNYNYDDKHWLNILAKATNADEKNYVKSISGKINALSSTTKLFKKISKMSKTTVILNKDTELNWDKSFEINYTQMLNENKSILKYDAGLKGYFNNYINDINKLLNNKNLVDENVKNLLTENLKALKDVIKILSNDVTTTTTKGELTTEGFIDGVAMVLMSPILFIINYVYGDGFISALKETYKDIKKEFKDSNETLSALKDIRANKTSFIPIDIKEFNKVTGININVLSFITGNKKLDTAKDIMSLLVKTDKLFKNYIKNNVGAIYSNYYVNKDKLTVLGHDIKDKLELFGNRAIGDIYDFNINAEMKKDKANNLKVDSYRYRIIGVDSNDGDIGVYILRYLKVNGVNIMFYTKHSFSLKKKIVDDKSIEIDFELFNFLLDTYQGKNPYPDSLRGLHRLAEGMDAEEQDVITSFNKLDTLIVDRKILADVSKSLNLNMDFISEWGVDDKQTVSDLARLYFNMQYESFYDIEEGFEYGVMPSSVYGGYEIEKLIKLEHNKLLKKSKLTKENTVGVTMEKEELTVESAITQLNKNIVLLGQYSEMLTTENAVYVNKLKPFFIDSVQRIVASVDNIKTRLFIKNDVFQDKVNELTSYGRANKTIRDLRFSQYSGMMVPVMLGANSNHLTASQKLLEFPKYVNLVNEAIVAFMHNLEQMMNEGSDDRIVLRKHNDRFFKIIEAKNETSELINNLIVSKASTDQIKLEKVLPNFNSLDTIKDNYIKVCKELSKVNILDLSDNVSELVETINTWQSVLKKQDDTRHSAYMIEDIKDNTVHLAEMITNIGSLLTITFQYITFYNKTILLLEEKTN